MSSKALFVSTLLLAVALTGTAFAAEPIPDEVTVTEILPAAIEVPAATPAFPGAQAQGEQGDLEADVELYFQGEGDRENKAAAVVCGSWKYAGCCLSTTRYTRNCHFGPDYWTETMCSGPCRL